MKIAIVIPDFEKVSFFIVIAKTLNRLGHEIIFYSEAIHIRHAVSVHSFQTSKTITVFDEVDMVLFWNGSGTKEKKYCVEKEVKSWYFENGYWQGETIQLNKGGVNNEAIYAQLPSEKITDFFFSEVSIQMNHIDCKVPVKFSYIYYFLEQTKKIFVGDCKKVFKSVNDIYKRKVTYKRFQSSDSETFEENNYAFFPLQVNSDTQLIYNSPYESMSQIIDLLKVFFTNDNKLLLKYHPREFEEYVIPTSDSVVLYKKISLEKAVFNANYVITVNSSVGFQALEKHKKVLHLGHSFYDQFPGVVKCNLLVDNFVQKTQELDDLEVNWKQLDDLMNHFRKNIFIPGDWRNLNEETVARIVGRILA